MAGLTNKIGAAFLSPLLGLRDAWEDAVSIMDADYRGRHPRALSAVLLFVPVLLAAWIVYVPIHELLHVAGCLLAGGTVQELEIDALYGGHLLARIFDWVRVGSEYAGRLSGFDTGGSDLTYLVLVAAPYVLTLAGVPLLRLVVRRRNLPGLGPAALLAFVPFANLHGDYNEIGSILSSRLAAWITGRPLAVFEGLRSDDLFKTLGRLAESAPQASPAGRLAVVAAGFVLGVLAAGLTYRISSLAARAFGFGRPEAGQ